METVLRVILEDNEDNAVYSVKLYLELHRSFRQLFEPQVQPFLEFVSKLYTNFPAIVVKSLQDQAGDHQTANEEAQQEDQDMDPASKIGAGVQLTPSSHSCKVLIECPFVVMLLFQAHTKVASMHLKVLVQKILDSFKIPITPPSQSSKSQPVRLRYVDLIAAQVKVSY